MINLQALFLSLPPSSTDSPVRTLFRGIRFSMIDLDRVCPKLPVSDGRRRILGEEGNDGDVEVPKRPANDEPKLDMLDRGEVGDMTKDPVGVLGDDDDVPSCSTMSFICLILGHTRQYS